MSTPSLPLPLNKYLKQPKAERTWLVDQLIPSGGLVNIFSSPKVGKSWWALDLARAVSQGDDSWMNHAIPRQARVMYIQLDTPRSLWMDRFEQLKASGVDFTTNEVSDTTEDDCDFFLSADMENVPYPFNICTPESFNWLKLAVDTLKPELVVIDTIRETHDLDEDKAGPMKQVLTHIRAACMPADSPPPAVLIVSHSRKVNPKADGGLMEEGRGANYVAGRADVVIRLTAKEGSDTCRMIYRGRASKHNAQVLVRDEKTLLWHLKDDPKAAAQAAWKADVAFIARNPDNAKKTLAERGRLLNALHTDRTHDACVAAIRRYKF